MTINKLAPLGLILVVACGPNGTIEEPVDCVPEDVCAVEGVEECAPDCENCISDERLAFQLQAAFDSGYGEGKGKELCRREVCTEADRGKEECSFEYFACETHCVKSGKFCHEHR